MENIVLITSVVRHPRKFLQIASIMSDRDRYLQTKTTIQSIRQYFPSATKIVMVECSPLDDEETRYFENHVDVFENLFYSSDKRICDRILDSGSKSMGEGTMTAYAIEHIILAREMNFTHFFKISGRYFLNEKFRYSYWGDNDQIVIKHLDPDYSIFTFFYKLPARYVPLWLAFLQSEECETCMQRGIGYELVYGNFVKQCSNQNQNLLVLDDSQHIGINGYFAPCGNRLDI